MVLGGAFGPHLAQRNLEILEQRGEGPSQALAPADHHIIKTLARMRRHDGFGGSAQTATNAITDDGIADLAGDREADTQRRQRVGHPSRGLDGRGLRAHLQDQARRYPLPPLGRDKQEFPPPLEAGESAHG